ncbi:putative leucine-rich repeat-containing protein DDB_G0290503 [Argopecten irradians]|uniref:putative leucine-rich repeat-containing protein DDB_G0290503 n=1 Tax=Argopecten irradians TaxID=31199 RepID=UPI0037171258
MYLNQLTTRELFSNNLSDRHEYGDGNESFSQLQSSQYNEMMTQNSQDAFNSQPLVSSGSESQGQRRFLDNYINHQSRGHGNVHQSKNLKNDHHGSAVSTKSNFQQQLQLNKARAKEKDERDLLNVVVKTVKECSEDVKCSMNDMRNTLGRSVNSSDDKLSEMMSLVSQNMQKNCEKMLMAIQERDENRNRQTCLEQELKQKKERIQELEQQVKEAHEMGFRNVVESVRDVVDQHHSVTKEKLERLADITSELLDHQKEMIDYQRQGMDQQYQLNQDVQEAVRAQTGTDDKSVLDELLKLRQELDQHRYELENFCREKVYATQRQTEDLKKTIRTGLECNAQETIEHAKHLYKTHFQQIKENFSKQEDNLKGFIDRKLNEKSTKYNAALNSEQEETSWTGKSQKRFSEYHESIPKKIQDQLDEMHSNHMKEVERIRKEINQRNKESINKLDSVVQRKNNLPRSQFLESRGMDDDAQQVRNSFEFRQGKNSLFISPGNIRSTGWTAKQLFSRSNPSPVATVYPQQTDNARPSTEEQTTKSKPRESVQPQRRSQRLMETKETAAEERMQIPVNENRKSQRVSVQEYGSKGEDRQTGRCSNSNTVPYQQRRQNNSPLEKDSGRTASENRQELSQNMLPNQRQTLRQELTKGGKDNFDKPPVTWQRKTKTNKNSCSLKNTEIPSRTSREDGFCIQVTGKPNSQCFSNTCGPNGKPASVYDFSDDLSVVGPKPTRLPSRSLNVVNSRDQHEQSEEYSQDMSSSRESSPSLSVTKIVIQRKVKREKTTRYQTLEAATKNLDSQGQYKECNDDLLSILGSIDGHDNYTSDQPEKCDFQKRKRPMADYSFGTTYAQVTESLHKKRKNIR